MKKINFQKNFKIKKNKFSKKCSKIKLVTTIYIAKNLMKDKSI